MNKTLIYTLALLAACTSGGTDGEDSDSDTDPDSDSDTAGWCLSPIDTNADTGPNAWNDSADTGLSVCLDFAFDSDTATLGATVPATQEKAKKPRVDAIHDVMELLPADVANRLKALVPEED